MNNYEKLQCELNEVRTDLIKRIKECKEMSKSSVARQKIMTTSWYTSMIIQHNQKMIFMEYSILENITREEYMELDEWLDNLGEYLWNILYNIAAGKEVTL